MNIRLPFILLLGRPGSGKSAIYKLLQEKFKKEDIADEFERIDDFPILKELIDKDVEERRHIKKDGGFAVTDWSIIDEVLEVVNKRAFEKVKDRKIIFIEFARADYKKALSNFTEDFLNNSVILYVKVDFAKCLARNEERFIKAKEKNLDDHIVPPDLMRSYYKDDDIEKVLLEEGENKLREYLPCDIFILDNNVEGLDLLSENLDEFVEYYKGLIKDVN